MRFTTIATIVASYCCTMTSAKVGGPKENPQERDLNVSGTSNGPQRLEPPSDTLFTPLGESRYPGDDEHDEGYSGEASNRIVGGTQVDAPGIYPFFVSWDGSCGGSLIHSDLVLTAAHCNSILSNRITVNAYRLNRDDTEGAVPGRVRSRHRHPEYNSRTLSNDFMILKLRTPVTSIDPVPFNTDGSVPAANDNLKVIGLGTTRSGGSQSTYLQEVTVKTYSDQACDDYYSGGIVRDTMFCAGNDAGGKDSCQGDSGGPIFTYDENGRAVSQVGVVSWGEGCALRGYPGVYAEISAVQQWIEDQICNLSSDKPSYCNGGNGSDSGPPAADEATIEIVVTTDDYPNEISWVLRETNGRLIASAPRGFFSEANKRYEWAINVKKSATYEFTISDLERDGICCDYGEGSYEIKLKSTGRVLVSGGKYEATERSVFQPLDNNNTPPVAPPPSPPANPPATPPSPPPPPPATPSPPPPTPIEDSCVSSGSCSIFSSCGDCCNGASCTFWFFGCECN
mmetsp:Transcript_11660/g.16471  ORF Transcript_11660/g.16471 Transcript_11660/m.16471 type:complete len:511 (+) Transcript_11660:3-1535(+)